MTYCINCGEKMQVEAAFCFACGTKKFGKDKATKAETIQTKTEQSSRQPEKPQAPKTKHAVAASTLPQPKKPATFSSKTSITIAHSNTDINSTANANAAATKAVGAVKIPIAATKKAQIETSSKISTKPEDGSINAKAETAPATKTRKKIWRIVLKVVLFGVLAFILLIAGLFLYEHLLLKSNTPPKALMDQPVSATVQRRFDAQAANISRLIAEVEEIRLRQEVEFDIAKETRQIKAMGEFVKKYPETPFYSDAEDEARTFLDEQGTLGAYRVYKKYFGDTGFDYEGISERSNNIATYIGRLGRNGIIGPGEIIYNSGLSIKGNFDNDLYRPTGDATVTFVDGGVLKGTFEDRVLQQSYTCRSKNGGKCYLPSSHTFFKDE